MIQKKSFFFFNKFFFLDPDGIIIKHTRIQDSAGRWRIEFEPTKLGIYQIQTNIDESKLILASMDILPLNYERHIYGERIIHPNVLNFISINSHNENLKIELKGYEIYLIYFIRKEKNNIFNRFT